MLIQSLLVTEKPALIQKPHGCILSQLSCSLALLDRGLFGRLGALLQELDKPVDLHHRSSISSAKTNADTERMHTTHQRQHVQPHEAAHERVHAEAQVRAEQQDAVPCHDRSGRN